MDFLLRNQGAAPFLVATQGALVAAPFILAAGKPVLSIGGFDSSYPFPTLDEFRHMVDTRQVRYVLLGGLGAMTAGFGTSFSISMWVKNTGKMIESGSYGGYAYFCTLYQMW